MARSTTKSTTAGTEKTGTETVKKTAKAPEAKARTRSTQPREPEVASMPQEASPSLRKPLRPLQAPVSPADRKALEPLIRERAYYLYLKRTANEGDAASDWITAETEILAEWRDRGL
ncbi:MAG: hypothetical protein A2284_07910 [Deltaproteobacteria bacterium RIFOXYA12_FULL_61_11]|nr:MAG: hypothetical protein A2284_07910 [Deltaproteobacteria bacterium RIFOXYA12_FULL_61_11]